MNFLDIETRTQERSNRWRNILALCLVVGAVGTVGWSVASSVTTGNVSDFLGALTSESFPHAEDKAAVKAGGDIMVAPVHVPPPPRLQGTLLSASDLSAEGVLVKDVASGALLYEKQAYTPRPIASITKLMSALVILEKRPEWTATTTVSADSVPDTHMYAGDTYTLEELWRAALVASSNKAILTLADAVGWPRDAFIERMNQKARELGMLDTYFTDPSGLDAGNISTPSDVLLLLKEALKHESLQGSLLLPEHQLYSLEREKQHHMWNTNWLLLGWVPHGFDAVLGGKTGYIPESGYNFTARVRDARGHELDIVVLGAPMHEDRFTVLRDVGDWAFAEYVWEGDSVSSDEGVPTP